VQDAKPAASQTEDILNSILPPREFEDASALWLQTVSSQPATRLDVIHLQETLDRQLQKRQARETGICPVREELYAQCFDELIRQTTVNCAERGLLLLRVRDEMRMSIMAYQTLYESAVAFGMRKALSTEQGKAEMEATIATQKETIATLERELREWKHKCEANEEHAADEKARTAKDFEEKIRTLEVERNQALSALKNHQRGVAEEKK
jgi:dynein light intermediate chain